MKKIYDQAFLGEGIVPFADAHLSIASSAVLYGLSVYTVFSVLPTHKGAAAFCLRDHYARLVRSARIMGIDTFDAQWDFDRFVEAVRDLVLANKIEEKVLIRATIHVSELLPGAKSRGLETVLSMFVYAASPVLPLDGARIKTSIWRRVSDNAIPSRAKVNGSYVNAVLGRQDALDSGYDDCLFLDAMGHVCELSVANIFLVRDGVLITPHRSADILEGVSRKVVLKMAQEMNISTEESMIDLTELYSADEVFASGTSAFIAPITEIDARPIGKGIGPITQQIKGQYENLMKDARVENQYLTLLTE